MSTPTHYLACDLGAGSGRVILGTLADGRLSLEEINRFDNEPVEVARSLRWNVLQLFDNIKAGLRLAGKRDLPISGISTDSWGVDYVLLRGSEPMLTAPYNYRDARTDGILERAFETVPAETIFKQTGIQFMELNTLFQLIADRETRPEILKFADQFLNIGDYFNYLLSGVARAEASLASTTQVYNPRRRQWARPLISKFKLPRKIFPEIVDSGTVLGPLQPELANELGLADAKVIASCSHDTGAAVAAVPAAQDKRWAFLSSGTWSLLGIENPRPIINDRSREHNFTNEEGYGGTTRFLKNIVGLWIQQQCRKEWIGQGHEFGYVELAKMAAASEPLRSLINPNDPRFVKPGDMPRKIADYCRETGQPVPETPGEHICCVLQSLALLYRKTLDEIGIVTRKKPKVLHIVGGGSQNVFLNQCSANATGLPVHTGPVEATAIGNVLIQALALGHLGSLEELREVVRQSFPIEIYKPEDRKSWDEAYDRFVKLPI